MPKIVDMGEKGGVGRISGTITCGAVLVTWQAELGEAEKRKRRPKGNRRMGQRP